MGTSLSSILAFVLLLGPATNPASRSAERGLGVDLFAPDSPERAYLELIQSIRAGDFDAALDSLQPVPQRFAAWSRVKMRTLHQVESLKPRMVKHFGPDSIDDLNMGFMPDKSLRSVRAEITGDTATLSFVTADINERERSEITVRRMGGEWKVDWRNYEYPWVGPDETEQLTDEDIRQEVEGLPRIEQAVQRVARDIEGGKFANPSEAQEAILVEITFGRR